MRKLLFSFMLSVPFTAIAQSNFSISASTGYLFPFSADYQVETFNGSNTDNTAGYSNTYHYKMKPFSLGSGIYSELLAGYVTKKGFGFELGAGYLQMAAFEQHYERFEYDDFGNGYYSNTVYKGLYRSEGQSMRMVAGLSYQSDISERIVFRFHTGMINGFANSFSQSSEETDIRTYPLWIGGPDTSETNTLTEVIKYSGGIAWGLYTNAGLAYNINSHFSLGIEGKASLISWGPKRGKITEYKRNGVDQLAQMSVSQKEVEFCYDYSVSYSSSAPPNTNEPSKSSRYHLPANALGIQILFLYHFGAAE